MDEIQEPLSARYKQNLSSKGHKYSFVTSYYFCHFFMYRPVINFEFPFVWRITRWNYYLAIQSEMSLKKLIQCSDVFPFEKFQQPLLLPPAREASSLH